MGRTRTGRLYSISPAIGGAAAIIVGSVSPWVTVATVFGSISVSGTDGDGVITLAGGAVIALLVRSIQFLRGNQSAQILTAAVLLYDLVNVNRNVGDAANEFATASVGWVSGWRLRVQWSPSELHLPLNRAKPQEERPSGSWSAPAAP